MSKLRLGIIGTGGMARAHARNLERIRGVELTACCDINLPRARAFAEEYGVKRAAESVEDLLDAVQAVCIVTPDAAHAALALQALAAGRHVLCEKPLTTNLTDARKVARAAQAAARSHGCIHMVNFSYRNSPALQRAIALAQRGRLGEIRHVQGHYLQGWLVNNYWGHWTEEMWLWRLQTARGSGGVLGDIGCHLLDFITAVAGDLRAIRCTLATFPKVSRRGRPVHEHDGAPLDANDSAYMELQFEDGALGACHTTRWAGGRKNSLALEVYGTRGALAIDLDAGWDKLRVCLGKQFKAAEWTTLTIKPTPTIWQRFVRSIRTGVNDQPDIVRGARVQSYLDACARSAEEGQPERIRKWK